MKTFKYIWAVLPMLALAACQEKEAPESEKKAEPKKHTVKIHASLGGTKTTLQQVTPGNYKCSWEAGDVIYIYEKATAVSPDGSDVIDSSSGFVTSDPLASGGETATFTASFDEYWWETDPDYAGYTVTYSYLASTTNPWYMRENYETGEEYIPLLLERMQEIYGNGYRTSNDMLVSKWSSPVSARPSDISFQFARLGTIVEITLSGLQEGDVLKSGTWITGDKFIATVSLEDVVSYNPVTGSYYYDVLGMNEGSVPDDPTFHFIDFSCPDSSMPIVADADGKIVMYLRCLPGVIDDWFGMICKVERAGGEHSYSKSVPLSDLGRSLEFKDGGLTYFQVALLPALAETIPDGFQYTTSESPNHDGFSAVWKKGAHVSGYECYYVGDDESPKIPLTVSDFNDEYVGVSVASGLDPYIYSIYVRGIPETGFGPASFDWYEELLVVGSPVALEFAGNATLVDEASGIYYLRNRSNWYLEYANETAYIIASNTNFGSYYGASLTAKDRSQLWWFRTSYSQVYPGGLDSIEFTLGKWYDASTYIEADVYGILADQTEVHLNGTPAETKNDKKYKYDLTGYAGVKVSCASSATLDKVFLNYYK